MNNNAIGMFDSGVGGLTVMKEVITELPEEDIIYLGDTKRFPYGSKSKETIIKCTKQAIDFLLTKNVKAIVIACGTATSQALDEVKQIYNIPIIGIIEPTINYINDKDNIRSVGVIATAGTINSKSWEKNLFKMNPNLEVISKACPLLAPMAEEGWTENEIAKLTIKEYLKELHKVDSLILGCTHYPLFTKAIEEEMDKDVDIINTGKVVSKYLKRFLTEKSLLSTNSKGNYDIYLTDLDCNFEKVAKEFLNLPIELKKADILN